MKQFTRVLSILAAVLMLASVMQAQSRAARSGRLGPTGDTVPATPAATAVNPPENAMQIVAAALQLSTDQVAGLERMMQERQAAIAPLANMEKDLAAKLNDLLTNGGNAADIGAVVIRLHEVRMHMAKVQQDFLEGFAASLDPTQKEKWMHIRQAAQFLPVIHVFKAHHLV